MNYLEQHNKSGFKPGDLVIIKRKAEDYEKGWDNKWVDDMDELIGQPVRITGDFGTDGFRTYPIDDGDDEWCFPYFVLEKAVVIPQARLDGLEDAALRYQCLEEAGVENWEGFDEAMDNYLSS